MTITNPLLLQNPIEKIDSIEPQHVVPAISQVIQENNQQIEHLINQSNESSITWQKNGRAHV